MAMSLVYDSGSGGEDSGVWAGYFVSVDPTPRPLDVLVSVVPLTTPQPRWNLAGWACVGTLRESTRVNSQLTAIPLIPDVSGLPYTLLNLSGLELSSGRVLNFRTVRWNLNEWLGKCRVKVIFRT